MQNKLQELTDKLYNEGLSKGKQDAEQLIAKAQKEAEEIISKARQESSDIVLKASLEAEEYRKRVEAELKTASLQLVAALKNSIETEVTARVTDTQIKAAFQDLEFIKSLLKIALSSFDPRSNNIASLSLLLPEDNRHELDTFVMDSLQRELNIGIDIIYDKKTNRGFKIGPKDSGYHISFTDDDFQLLFSEYIRPKTSEFLFSK